MNLGLAYSLTTRILCFAMFMFAVEIFLGLQNKQIQRIWNFSKIKNDLYLGLPIPKRWIFTVFEDSQFQYIVQGQILIALVTFIEPHFLGFLLLIITNLIICIRFRGTFNGGSDMMTFVVLTGALGFSLSSSENTQKLSLIYIAIHCIYSYFKAGIVKVIHSEWRSGKALPAFLQRSLYYDVQIFAVKLKSQRFWNFLLCWSVLIFELGSLSLPFFKNYISIYALIAISFHFLVFIFFGLNRFFWVWLSAWPATIYAISII